MKKKESSINSSFEQLEQIVEELNSTEIDLEDSLKKFKQGTELIKQCKNKLKQAENEFIKLKNELEEYNE